MSTPIRFLSLTVVVVIAGSLTACGAGPVDEQSTVSSVETVSTHRTVKMEWEKTWDEAFSRAKAESKPVLVSFEAEWCVWCKKLETTTYRDSQVMALISESLVPLELDVDDEGRELSDVHSVESLPTVLVFNPAGEVQGRINGYLPPGQFVAAVSDILQES